MKIIPSRRLFWFYKEGIELDLSDKSHLDDYVQQVLTHGRIEDIQELFEIISRSDFIASFDRIKNFLPKHVERFWENYSEYTHESATAHP